MFIVIIYIYICISLYIYIYVYVHGISPVMYGIWVSGYGFYVKWKSVDGYSFNRLNPHLLLNKSTIYIICRSGSMIVIHQPAKCLHLRISCQSQLPFQPPHYVGLLQFNQLYPPKQQSCLDLWIQAPSILSLPQVYHGVSSLMVMQLISMADMYRTCFPKLLILQ